MQLAMVIKIKRGVLVLPKNVQKFWNDAEVVLMPSQDNLYIKKITRPSLSELRPKLRKLGKLISKKELNEAIQWAKEKTYKNSI